MSIKARIKKRLRKRLFPAVHLFRTYKYNLYAEEEHHLSNLIRNILATRKKLTGNKKTVLFYPDFPSAGFMISQILYFLGYGVTNNPDHKFDFAIKWEDATFSPQDQVLRGLEAQNASVVNINCVDISKAHVDEVFHSVFGYSVTVDPLTYTGNCVVKSNLNAQGGGRIISCPIDTIEADVVYNKLIDNEVEDGIVLHYRVPVL